MEKWVLITGATSGIGWATAEAFAEQGFNLLLTGRRHDRLLTLQTMLKSKKPQMKIELAAFDLSDRFEVSQFFKEKKELLPKIDILINNAGLACGVEKMQEASLDDWEVMIDTNVKGLLFMTRGLLPYFVEKKSGHIVNLGSVAGRWTYPGGGVYCATKFAVRALSEGLRMDLLGSNVRVTNIEPGMVNTEFSLVRLQNQEAANKVYEGMTPLQAKDIAETILWCALRPAHVNIQELVIYPTDQAHVGQVHRQGV